MVALFGKLPARRDFVAREVPSRILETLEPWLQHSMAQSRETLRERWLNLYLNAPIWRFWWAPGLAGQSIAGAMMPSADAMGRYFPLLAFDIAPPGTQFALPSLSDDRWYHAVETALLHALAEDITYEKVLEGLDTLPPGPRAAAGTRAVEGSLWWTLGGHGPPRRAAYSALPPPTAFADMLRDEPAERADPAASEPPDAADPPA